MDVLWKALPLYGDETKNRFSIDYDGSGCSAQLVQGQGTKTEAKDA